MDSAKEMNKKEAHNQPVQTRYKDSFSKNTRQGTVTRKIPDEADEIPMQQQRIVREVSDDKEENQTNRTISLTPLTNEDGLAQRRVVIRESEASDNEEVSRVEETEIYQSLDNAADVGKRQNR